MTITREWPCPACGKPLRFIEREGSPRASGSVNCYHCGRLLYYHPDTGLRDLGRTDTPAEQQRQAALLQRLADLRHAKKNGE